MILFLFDLFKFFFYFVWGKLLFRQILVNFETFCRSLFNLGFPHVSVSQNQLLRFDLSYSVIDTLTEFGKWKILSQIAETTDHKPNHLSTSSPTRTRYLLMYVGLNDDQFKLLKVNASIKCARNKSIEDFSNIDTNAYICTYTAVQFDRI